MATSVRLTEMLKVEAAAYASDLGISINALVAVALREYLDKRPARGPGSSAGPGVPSSRLGSAAPVVGAKKSPTKRLKRRR
jgi:hypothetical protein